MMTAMDQVENSPRTAVAITGGTSGIGKAVVDAVLEQGWISVVLDVNAGALADSRAAYARAGEIHFVEVDVAAESAIGQVVEAIERDIGPIAGLVNSAGMGRDIPFLDTDAATFKRILDVNLIGSFVVGQQVARRMLQRGAGSIVHVALFSGIMGNARRLAYGASKGGVTTMTKVPLMKTARLVLLAATAQNLRKLAKLRPMTALA